MKRKEKAAVDEFVALVGGKTWEPVRHKCMGKWSSGMTDYGFVIDGRITLFVSNSMAYFKKRIREWIKSIHTFEAKKDCYLRLLREQIEKDNDKAKDEKLNPVRLIDIGILSPKAIARLIFSPLCVSRNKRQAVQTSNSGIKLRYYGG